MPDFEKGFTIESDASGLGLEALLMQEDHPIVYWSQGLKGRALLLFTYEKEMMAIILTAKKWRQYFFWKSFTIKIDQRSLKYLFDQRVQKESQHP